MATVLGVEVPDLPEGFVVLETIVLVKGMMDDGMTLAVRYSTGLTKWETIGMLTAAGHEITDRAEAVSMPSISSEST